MTETDIPEMVPSAEERAVQLFIGTRDSATRFKLIEVAFRDGVLAERARAHTSARLTVFRRRLSWPIKLLSRMIQ